MKKTPSISAITAALAAAKNKSARSYSTEFWKNKKEGDDGWVLLWKIFDMTERLNDLGQPSSNGSRLFLPKDLTDDQIDWLRSLEKEVDDPEFCARLADIQWLRVKDRKAATRAVRYYMGAGLALEDLDNWAESIDRYSRAYRLATQLGRKGNLRSDVLDFLLARLRVVKGDDPRWWSLKIMYLLYEARHGEHTEMIEYASRAAKIAEHGSDFGRQRDYLELIAKLHHRERSLDVTEEVRVEIALSFRKEAEAAGSGANSHHHWEAAVKAFRERPSLKDQVQEMQSQLATAGREMLELMQGHSHSIDTSGIVNLIKAEFQGEPSDVVLYKLVSFALLDPDELRREAEEAKAEEAKHGFISSILESKFFDYEGRTVAVAPAALTPDDVGYEERIKSDVQRNASLRRSFAVSVKISNALRVVTSEHTIDAQFLTEHIADSAFIPEGRLEHYVEGLAYGFNRQFTPAALFLVPQFEAGLRNIAGQLGITPRNLQASGVEDAWGLERLLSEEAIKEQLGKPLTFELRSLLIEEFGPKFRHNLSHGLIPPIVLGNSTDAMYAWWLFLRLCVIPTAGYRAYIAGG